MYIERNVTLPGASCPPRWMPSWTWSPERVIDDCVESFNRRIQPGLEKGHSDVPKTGGDMDFSDALRAARAGKAVARRISPHWAILLVRGELFNSLTDTISGHHQVSKIDAIEEEDLLATDWFVVA